MAMSIEKFLADMPEPVAIIGGSPLIQPDGEEWPLLSPVKTYSDIPHFAEILKTAISINGFRAGAYAAAINNGRADSRRVRRWERVLLPNPSDYKGGLDVMLPEKDYGQGDIILRRFGVSAQPTTALSLVMICNALKIHTSLSGICGWASRWHCGDLEMHLFKHEMPFVTVHDPRPEW